MLRWAVLGRAARERGARRRAGPDRAVPALAAPDRGSVTAEFAVVLPAVVALVAALVWGLQLAATHVRIQDAAAVAARAVARGEALPQEVIFAAAPGAHAATRQQGELVCVEVTAGAEGPIGLVVALGAASCALGEGR